MLKWTYNYDAKSLNSVHWLNIVIVLFTNSMDCFSDNDAIIQHVNLWFVIGFLRHSSLLRSFLTYLPQK